MKQAIVWLSAAILSAGAYAQGPSGTMAKTGASIEVQANYARVKANVLKSADLMPADGYGYKPLPDIRTYARIVNHIIEAQVRSCGFANGTAAAAMAKTPADTASKAEIVAALQASFAECDKAYGAVTEANMAEMVSVGQNKRSRLGLLWGNAAHDMEQYAQLALYLRMKGIMPPSQEK